MDKEVKGIYTTAMTDLGEPLGKSPVNAMGQLPDVPAADVGAEEIERRVQAILDEWLRQYFTGEPVDMIVSGPDGVSPYHTFPKCHLLWNRDTFPKQDHDPVIHWLVGAATEGRCSRRPGFIGYEGEMTWNLFVRTSAQGKITPRPDQPYSDKEPDHVCRKIAGELKWLLRSPELRRLAALGVSRVRVPRGPDIVSAGQFFMRQLVVTHRYFYEVRVSA